ncbi:MAG: alpha/beta fold hydrolase [Gammaproteobacteria bacterium]|nr:alpha/beta fold hydrolase [Gammaproteobacteria bacterium]
MDTTNNPEIGLSLDIGGSKVNYHDQGTGEAVILLHGSGPGVTAYANWRLLIPALAPHFRVLAPDVVGFGYTEHPAPANYTLDGWIDFTIRFMDALQIEQANFVGNSFGGALALALAAKHPQRVKRFVMMGAAGIHFDMTDGLRKVWGYRPSFEAMRELMNVFAFRGDLISDEIVESRYQASMRPGYQEAYSQLFPEPMQEKLDGLCLPESVVAAVEHQVLLIHGKEDVIVPVRCSQRAHELLRNSDLHIYANCGHWTMFEKAEQFGELVRSFLSAAE